MKQIISNIILFSFVFLINNEKVSCQVQNISYGEDSSQIFDLYLPEYEAPGKTTTRVIILIHGGGWDGGDKGDAEAFIPYLKLVLPQYYIANLEYRLGSIESPALPKQLEDIDLVIKYIKSSFSSENIVEFALMGGSAGGHLATLYGYTFNNSDVKIIINQVGPADLTDPNYTEDPTFDEKSFVLLGPCLYTECPDKYVDASPITHIHEGIPPTIGFYGNADPLIPVSQMNILKSKLDQIGIVNRFTLYEGGHGGDWSFEDKANMILQISQFIRDNWL